MELPAGMAGQSFVRPDFAATLWIHPSMTLSTYLLYLAAVALLVLSPGPTMLMCMTTSLQHGPRKAMAAAAGSVSAVLGTMLLSALGLGALLAASETAFWILKAAGAAYLIWLGIKTFRSQGTVFDQMPEGATAAPTVPAHRLFVQGLIVGGSNPKAILFFTAFFPQFLSADKPLLAQVAVFGATFIIMGTLNSILYATLALQVRRLVRSYRARKNMNRATGGFLIAMGGLVGLAKRAA